MAPSGPVLQIRSRDLLMDCLTRSSLCAPGSLKTWIRVCHEQLILVSHNLSSLSCELRGLPGPEQVARVTAALSHTPKGWGFDS